MSDDRGAYPTGVPVDASGGPTIDPTANVIALSKASDKRQDDIREITGKLRDAQISCAKEVAALQFSHSQSLQNAESRRVDEQAALREHFQSVITTTQTHHFEKLAEKESARIDAIRKVDVDAVQTAAERASAQAAVLASQVSRTEETLRSLVATTAAAVANQLQQITTSIDTRLTALERSGNQAVGRQSFSDPQLVDLLTEVKALRDVGAGRTGRDAGITTSWGVIVAVAGLIIAGIVAFQALSGRAPSAPQVIYSPAPAASTQWPTAVPTAPGGSGIPAKP